MQGKEASAVERENKARPHIGKLVVYLLGTAGALVLLALSFTTFGWFTNSPTVSGSMNGVTAVDGVFELAAVGSSGKYDSYFNADDGINLSDIAEDGAGVIDPTATGSGKTEIKWMMSGDSNFGNITGDGIQPGSSGKLSFYVIAKENTDLDLTFSLDTILYTPDAEPLGADNPDNSEHIIPDTSAVAKLVKGHILFFKSFDEVSGVFSDRITDAFTFVRDNAQADTAYKVDIYWVWPEVIDQLLLPQGDDLLTFGGLDRIIAADDTVVTESGFSYFFSEEISGLTECLNNVTKGSADAAFSTDHHRILNAKWNEADQMIGTEVGYIELILTADVSRSGSV